MVSLNYGNKITDIKAEVEISGYASTFNVLDHNYDVILPGAFISSAFEGESLDPKEVKLLWQHEAFSPMGTIEYLKQDEVGLYIRALICLGVQKGLEAYNLLKIGALKGFSVGIAVIDSYYATNIYGEKVRYIKRALLREVSIVTFPANIHATINKIEIREDNAQLPLRSENKNNFTDSQDLERLSKSIDGARAALSRHFLDSFP